MGLHEKALDRLDEVVCLVDENSKLLFANKAIEKFGIKRDDAIGKNIDELLSFLTRNLYKKVFSGLTVKNKKWVSQNGKDYYLAIESSILDKNVAITVIKDVTAFKTIEKRMKDLKKMYEKIFDTANEGIYIEDDEGAIIFANTAFSRMIGYDKKEILGKRLQDLVRNYELKKLENKKYEIKIYTKNGYPKILLSSFQKLFEGNNMVGKISFNLDVTEAKEMKEKIKILSEKERNFRLKTAHYFFNPLAIAKGYMGLMVDEVEEGEREKVMKAIHAISRVENVIKNLVTRGEIAE